MCNQYVCTNWLTLIYQNLVSSLYKYTYDFVCFFNLI